MYDALDVAKYVINYCIDKEEPISNLKLQKVLYFLWVDYFKKTRKHLFDDDIYAWKFGPVIPEIYYEFCMYGGLPVRHKYKPNKNIANNDQEIINCIVDECSSLTAFQLVKKTHKEGTAWSKIYTEKGSRQIIPFDLIEELECKSC